MILGARTSLWARLSLFFVGVFVSTTLITGACLKLIKRPSKPSHEERLDRMPTVGDIENLIKSYCPTASEMHRVFQEECWGVRYDRDDERHTDK